MKLAERLFVTLILVSCFFKTDILLAQNSDGSLSAGAEEEGSRGTRPQLATIIFSGLGGAILGLSTLSFYGRPQERLENIAVGFAIGIIIGATYTTYLAATAPYYSEEVKFIESNKLDFDLAKDSNQRDSYHESRPLQLALKWSY